MQILWTFSIILESVCVLPQLLLLRQTNVPTVLDSFYLVTLGSYRFFYILNWLVILIKEGRFVPTTFVFGVVQTALYVDFAWVYWTRQRVKLRGGGLVDSDDLRKSYLVRRFIGRGGDRNSTEIEDGDEADTATLSAQENGTVRPSASRSGRSWGARGISVSADQNENDEDDDGAAYLDSAAGDAQMVDPSHFEDNSDGDDNTGAVPLPAKDTKSASKSLADDADEMEQDLDSSAVEWRDGGSK